MCLVSAIIAGVFSNNSATSADFFEFGILGSTSAKNGIITFWTCVILFQNLVPISLYISIEIVKTAQVFFIYSDVEMYYDKLDYPCIPKSWNISDDLGHSVITELISEDTTKIEFKAQSPDEAALVATARDMGYALIERTQRGVVLLIQGVKKEFEVLNILEFNSSRKRMSAIVRMPDTGKIMLFCKGADNVIYSRLAKNQNPDIRDSTLKDLDIFSNEGTYFPIPSFVRTDTNV